MSEARQWVSRCVAGLWLELRRRSIDSVPPLSPLALVVPLFVRGGAGRHLPNQSWDGQVGPCICRDPAFWKRSLCFAWGHGARLFTPYWVRFLVSLRGSRFSVGWRLGPRRYSAEFLWQGSSDDGRGSFVARRSRRVRHGRVARAICASAAPVGNARLQSVRSGSSHWCARPASARQWAS